MRSTIFISIISASLSWLPSPAFEASPDVRAGLQALRSGRFEDARGVFSRVSADEPEAPDGPFFEAFYLWWKLIDRPEDTSLRLSMEERLAEASRRARLVAASGENAKKDRALVLQGIALLLDAQSRASRGAHLSAASSARQGHRALTRALEDNPEDADALFAMGAYNYYADRLPLLVKGIRFLLLIPGGNAARGIAQLEKAGQGSALFGVESLMLLSHIFSGAYEEDHRQALGYVEKASARVPDSPLMALARADLLFELGLMREAERLARTALESIHAKDGYPPEIERALAFRAAACTLKLHDPIGALERIEAQLAGSAPDGAVEKKRWMALWAEAASEAGRADRLELWIRKLEIPQDAAASFRRRATAPASDQVAAPRAEALRRIASGAIEEGRARIQVLLDRHPDDLRLRYDLGRLLQQEGRLDEARPHLQAVAEKARASRMADLAGWAMLRLGWQLEMQGKRREALPYYHRAGDIRQFTFHPAALDRRTHPGSPEPEG